MTRTSAIAAFSAARALLALACVLACALAACASEPLELAPPPSSLAPALEAERQELLLGVTELDDDRLALDVRAEIHLASIVHEDAIALWLTPDATVESIEIDGHPAPHRALARPHARLDHASAWMVAVDPRQPASVLTVRYRLELGPATSVARAETSWYEHGILHLAEPDAWYPRLASGMPAVSVEARLPDGFEVCAEGARIGLPSTAGTVAIRFESDTPSHGLTLVAGRWRRSERKVAGNIVLRTLLSSHHPETLDQRYLDALEEALRDFDAWLGAYPFASFTVAEVPTGGILAFPGFTLIDPAAIAERQTLRTGVQHELLHTWLGHQVFLGPGGNWIEGLTTYLAEHEHFARASSDQARLLRKRLLRDHLGSVRGIADMPVNTFRRGTDHASQSIGYAKVAMIFHMLREQIGDAAFYGGLRELVRRYRFEPATWEDLLVIFEQQSGQRLARFSIEWLERTGAPEVALTGATTPGPAHASATADTAPHRLELRLSQADPAYQLRVPIAVDLVTGERFRTHVEVEALRDATVELEVPARPLRVELDPDYEIFRALNTDEVEPTLRETFAADAPTIAVVTAADAPPGALEDGVELALAAQLAARFESLAAADAIDSERPALLVVPRAELSSLASHFDLPAELDWSDARTPRLGGTSLVAGESIVFATRTRRGAPRVVVALDESADVTRVLLALERFASWSHVVFEGSEPARRGMWLARPASMSREL